MTVYDVALSFASENRVYVHAVADGLTAAGIRVYCYAYEQAHAWGSDLESHLEKIYRETTLPVIFISASYARKTWTKYEREWIHARDDGRQRARVFYARFDDTRIPGALPQYGYVDLRRTSPNAFVQLVKQKLRQMSPSEFATLNEPELGISDPAEEDSRPDDESVSQAPGGAVDGDAIVSLDRAVPYYQPENLRVRDSGERFSVAIPAPWRDRLAEFEFRTSPQIVFGAADDLTALDRGSASAGLVAFPGLAERVVAQRECVAEQLWQELEAGNPRFNGEMFAPRRVNPGRTVVGEQSVFVMSTYRTDYFTYRVMRAVYRELRAEGYDFDLTADFVSYNKIAMFTTSFGVNCFLIVNDGSGDAVLLCRRSRRLAVNPAKWHFSMNEAFNHKDIERSQLHEVPSLKQCAIRGFDEEIGLAEHHVVAGSLRFTEVAIVVDCCEMGILCHARVEFDGEFTRERFLADRNTAQDVTLETMEHRFVPMSLVPTFIDVFRDEISSGCIWGLERLASRSAKGYTD